MGDQSLLEFIRWLLSSAGTGAAVFVTIEQVQKLWPARWAPLTGDQKFYLAWVLSFVYPLLAYFAELALLNIAVSWVGLFATVASGYMASQGLHRQSEKQDAAPASNA